VPEDLPRPVRALLLRARAALFDVDEARLSALRRWAIVAARFAWLGLSSFFRDRLQIRAASLSFSTLLAVVPALALAFALANATGYVKTLSDDTIRPFIDETLPDDGATAGVHALRTTLLAVIALVEGTSLAGLGLGGLVVLGAAVYRVVRGVDEAFTHIFARMGPMRSPWQRVRATLIVSLVTPIGLSYAVTSASLAHGGAAAAIRDAVPWPWIADGLLFVLPPLVVTATLFVLYVELPDTKVSWRSAAFGAIVAGIAWYVTQLLHVRFQVGLARWNAIYSGFGAFPVLLASVQVSWVIVLIGAQLVALHQRSPTLRVLGTAARRDFASLSALGMEVAVALASEREPAALSALAAGLRTDEDTLGLVLDALVARGIVSALEAPLGRRYALAVDAGTLRTRDVLDALEHDPHAELPWDEASPAVREVLAKHREESVASQHNLTIAELKARAADRT
jgi:membrane protein